MLSKRKQQRAAIIKQGFDKLPSSPPRFERRLVTRDDVHLGHFPIAFLGLTCTPKAKVIMINMHIAWKEAKKRFKHPNQIGRTKATKKFNQLRKIKDEENEAKMPLGTNQGHVSN